MGLIQRIEDYGNSHHPKWLSVLRILLGIMLLSKGITFLADRTLLLDIFQHSTLGLWGQLVSPFIAPTHVVGGILIAIGLITRIAAAFQIPILLGAVFFVNITQGLGANSELAYSIMVLFLLVFFLIYGSGHFSVGQYMRTHKDR